MTATIPILTVTTLNQLSKRILEQQIGRIWVEGEISNLSMPGSGHLYFTLKDSQAQIRCALFRQQGQYLDFTIKDGLQVIVQANVSLYEPRGDYQLIVARLRLRGEGALQQAFEALKQKLLAEGLFDKERKRNLPAFPNAVGVITSSTGSVVRDIIHILKRRAPYIPIIIYPTLVQGARAAPAIVDAIQRANCHQRCDVLIVGRGGGSLEDLWGFNSEEVARAIAKSRIPIVSAVGHETDTTIADYAADIRAPTPSGAAELISPDTEDLWQTIQHYQKRLCSLLSYTLQKAAQRLDYYHRRCQHPKQRLIWQRQRLESHQQRLLHAISHRYQQQQQHLQGLARALEAVGPLATLHRGYAVVTKLNTKEILRDSGLIQLGDYVAVQLAKGKILCEVKKII